MEKFWQSISAEKAREIILKNAQSKNFCILDVRTQAEFFSGAMDNAINLDFYASDFLEKLDLLDKNKIYLIYCRSGNRSKFVLEEMKKRNFNFVYELDDGFLNFKFA